MMLAALLLAVTEIVFPDGVHFLDKPLDVKSGTVLRAEHPGKAILCGARPVTGWKREGDLRVADVPFEGEIPDLCGGGEECYALVINYPLWLYRGGERLPLSAFPKPQDEPERMEEGYLRTGEPIGDRRTRKSGNTLKVRSHSGVFKVDSPVLERLAAERELYAYGLFCVEYHDMRLAVTNVDPAARTVALDTRRYARGFKKDAPFRFLNAVSQISRPGEWAIDRRARKLYLKAENPDGVLIGTTMDLIRGTGVRDVTIDGLVLRGSRRDAIRMTGVTNVTVRNCRIEATGAWGARFFNSSGVRVTDTVLTHLGEGGVELEGGVRETLTPGANEVAHCEISHFGEVIPSYRPGVSLRGVGNRCVGNHIHHTLHQAVWFNGNDHLIARNDIHDTCLYNDDAGAIYTCAKDWTKRGSVIEANRIAHTGKRPKATRTDAIYIDDFTSGTIVRSNVVIRATNGVHIGGGNGNRIEDNSFTDCDRSVWLDMRRGWAFREGGTNSALYARLRADRDLLASPLWSSRYPDLVRLAAMTNVFLAHEPIMNVVRGNRRVRSGPFHCTAMREMLPLNDVSDPLKELVPAEEVHARTGIGNTLAKLEAGAPVTVAYLGGSITSMDGWRRLSTEWMRKTWPKSRIAGVDAAIGGTGSKLGAFRLAHDALAKEPDLLFVEFATNDRHLPAEEIWPTFDGIVQQTWAKNPKTDIVFVYTITYRMTNDYLVGRMNGSASAMEKMADHYGIPSICFGPRVTDEIRAGRLVMSMAEAAVPVPKAAPDRDRRVCEALKKRGKILFSRDGVHPLLPGHAFYLQSVVAGFEAMRALPPVDHAPFVGHPFFSDRFVAAKMAPIDPSMLKGAGWTKLAPDTQEQKSFGHFGGQFYRADRPGARLVFRFRGTYCDIYDLLGPKGAGLKVTVDGKVTQAFKPRFDA